MTGEPRSLEFSRIARALGNEARRRGLIVPGFRSPPKRPNVTRSIRIHATGAVTVSVRITDRPLALVALDMAAGVAQANGLGGLAAVNLAAELVESLELEVAP